METIIGKEFPKKVIPLIDKAKSSIKIIVFDWRFHDKDIASSIQLFNQSIIRAARRGVKIQVLTNNENIAQLLKNFGIEVRVLHSKKLVHAKLMIIDDYFFILGSHNYSFNAFENNLEVSLILDNHKELKLLIDYFNMLWQS